MLTDELRYKILKRLEADPNLSQRELAKELDMSLGKVNYCLKALLEMGWIKASNFKNSQNKRAYAYCLTPAGVEEKATVTVRFLKRKVQEHKEIQLAIEELRQEVAETKHMKTTYDTEYL